VEAPRSRIGTSETAHEHDTVVGDDVQAIYGFRAADGAHPQLTSLYRETTVIKLERNYRSPQPLAGTSNGPGRSRTCDLGIKSPLLYQLSYRPPPGPV
jgi:hypothetical protein